MIKLINVNDLDEDSSKGFELNNQYLFAVRKDGEFFLYWNRCPHLGTPLEWEEDRFLDSDGALIQCSTHWALFQIDSGLCLVGPCKGKSLQAIPFVIEEGMISVEEAYFNTRSPHN
jgi:nitrite reductase/ring-hydroxylating ferredoxin subunit